MKALFLLVFLLLPLNVLAQQEPLNAGLVSGIWYSKFPFFAGETVRIYTAIQNNSGNDLKGKVQFSKNSEPIGDAPFSALKGGLIQVWADWEAKEGTYKISAKIVEATPPVLSSFALAQHEVSVDKDTDKDNIGNTRDLDDDNDGLTDEKEQIIGTDPLNPDTDQDGVKDGEDVIEEKTKEPTNLVVQVEEEAEMFFENILEDLRERKEAVEQKIAANEDKKPIFKLPIVPENRVPSKDAFENLLLAAAITALPYWKVGILILGVIILWKILSRFVF